jgi:hypothetical protein
VEFTLVRFHRDERFSSLRAPETAPRVKAAQIDTQEGQSTLREVATKTV